MAYFLIIIQVLGGLALFIYGMSRLSNSLQKITSNRFKTIINTVSKRSWSGVLIGLFTTMVIQSSSATSVMTIGFVNAGLLTLRQAIGIIMGANIGTTITAQLISLKFEAIVFPLIIIGFLINFLGRRRKIKIIGMTVLSLGILFLGMILMKQALGPLKDNEGFKNFLLIFSKNPFLGIMAGLLLTALLQSSSATIGLLIALASQGLIPIEAAIPILIGDNIGTCATALLASIGTTITAKRTAFSHLMFNIFGAIIFAILLYGFKVESFIIAWTGSSIERQIANIHTSFNVITTIILFPMIGLFEKVVIRIFPGKDVVINKNAIFLDNRLLQNPAISLEQTKKELQRVTKITQEMFNLSLERLNDKNTAIEQKLLDRESAVDSLTEDIIRYLTKISQRSLGFRQSNELTNLLHVAYDAERTGDHSESIMYLIQVKEENNMKFSIVENKELSQISEKVNNMYSILLSNIEKNTIEKHAECEKIEADIDKMVMNIRTNHLIRLREGKCMPTSGVIFADIILHIERISDLLLRISKNTSSTNL